MADAGPILIAMWVVIGVIASKHPAFIEILVICGALTTCGIAH